MPKRRSLFPRAGAAFAALALALVLAAGPDTAARAAEPVGPKLTPELRELLRREMQQVLEASQDILAAQATGDYDTVATLAQQIADSFILERELTEGQRKTLESALPPGFVALDKDFHETATQLAAAARAHDKDRVRALFGWLVRACGECHGRFAADRFPGFAGR